MSFKEITDSLHTSLKQCGFKSTIVSSKHVKELRSRIEKGLASGKINDGVYHQYKESFDLMLTENVPWVQSIIVVAVPVPILEVTFTIDGNKRSTIIPPTYDHSVDETVATTIETALKPHGFQSLRASLPQKLLAAHSGLARYGKNNIAYVDGMGSFHRLLAFYTDLPCVNDCWQEAKALDECTKCQACINKCPSGAIDPDQFQVRAERCLTFHNESAEPFPDWIDESWHHCLAGCMRCQDYCPVNKDVRNWIEPFTELTEEESALILNGTKEDELPISLKDKFKHTSLLDDRIGLSRNLMSLLKSTGYRPTQAI